MIGVKMRMHALQALVGGIIGIAAIVYGRFVPAVTKNLGGYIFFSLVALVIYVAAIAIALYDNRIAHDEALARGLKGWMIAIGLSSLFCALFLGRTRGEGALHTVSALILLSALLSLPRSPYDPLL